MVKINPASLISKFANSKVGQYLGNPAATAAVGIATASNVTKDAVNCIYYVTQSWNNERIPEDQRKFVAGLDAANGVLNVLLQLGVTAAFSKKIAEIFDNVIEPRYFTEAKYKEFYPDFATKFKPGELLKKIDLHKGFAKTGFCLLATLISLQVIVKRIIVPFIATPMASIFKNQMEKMTNSKEQEEKKDLQIANA